METATKPGACRIPGWGVGLTALVAVILLFAGASDVLGQTLNGVSCDDVVANGTAAQDPSERGFNNPVAGTPLALPPRSGFDYLGASVWVRNNGINGCGAELNELYLCLEIAGRWGDADGDGVRDAQGSLCGDPAINPGSDGPLGEVPLSRNEALTFFVDRDCDGFADLQLEVAGMAGGSPTLIVTADEYTGMQGTDLGGEGVTFEYSDKDNTAYTTCPAEVTTQVLVRVPNWSSYFTFAGPPYLSPAVFSYNINGGNRVDGPPEDNVRGSVDVADPMISIEKDPDLALCEGQQGNLTITVTNTGNVKVSNIMVTDELPVGWTSCGVVSGGVTVEQVGTNLTFSSFDLEPCEVKEIVFCIEAGAECTSGPNNAAAEGAHLADCLDGGGRGVGPVTASSELTCLADPCIEIRCAVNPLEVCAGDEYTVEVWGTNCSADPEDITLWIDGESQFFGDVAPGAEVHFDWTFTAPVDCPAGTVTNHLTRAVATNECNPDPGVEATCPVSVTCLPEPCVELVCDVDKPEVCPGEQYTVTATATNCSDGPEDIVIYIDGNLVLVKEIGATTRPDRRFALTGIEENSKLFENVPAGEKVTYELTFVAPVDCEPFSTIPHNTRAVATNQCNPDPGVMDECQTAVTCLPEPCVEITCDVDKPEVCPGTDYTVTATATNCSAGAEDITIYIDNESKLFQDVAAGAEVTFEWTFTAPAECEPGSTIPHSTRAVATNVCNPEPGVEATCDVAVTCLPEPCVEVSCDAPAAACDGQEITVSGTAINCSAGAEDITVTISGPSGPIGSLLFEDVPAGESVTHSETFLHDCDAVQPAITDEGAQKFDVSAVNDVPPPVVYFASATATNSCGETSDLSDGCAVECSPEPCVELVCDVDKPEVCPGTDYTVTATATNCSDGPEDITVYIDGESKLFENVAVGAEVTFEWTFTAPAECEPGSSIPHATRALATNICNPDGVEDTCDTAVTCLPEPCVEVSCEAPQAACDGDEITVSGTAINCSAGAEDITVTISGPSGPIGFLTFEDVPAGESVTHSETFIHDCDAVVPTADGAEGAAVPAPVIYFASATATNSCGEASDLSDGCPVECLPEPCVELVCDVDKPEVCPDEEYTVTATATNCSEGVEDITIYIDGESKLFPDVAVGAEVTFEWTFTAPVDCEPGSSIPHATRAVATNICNPDGVEDTCDVTVTCLPEPCVEVSCDAPAAACDGEEITVSGTAINCSAGPEDITVTISGPSGPIGSLLFSDVPAGESVTHSETFVHDCDAVVPTADGGEAAVPAPVIYFASATATNSCGEASDLSDGCAVECLPEPCVELVCDVDKPEVCPDEEYTVTATATNCSEGVEDITIYIDGESKLFPDVAVGAEVTFEWTFTAPADCEPGSSIPHATRAVATNQCNEDPGVEDTCDTAVTCLPEPCVEVSCEAPQAACDGDEITVSGTAINCSAGAEDITVTISGPSGPIGFLTFEDVPAGESVTHSETFIHDCDAVVPTADGAEGAAVPAPVIYFASATATNSCGEASDLSDGCAVECLPEPCVELVCDVDKPEVCPDEEYTVTATATNCSEGVEDITIYIDGESKLFPDVAVGAEVTFEWTFTAPVDCEPGSSIPHATRAVATNICNPDGVEDTCDVTVTCLPEPCVEVSCDAPAAACDGEEITVSGTAINCSAGPEDITVTISGPSGPIGSLLFSDVPAGESVTHSETFVHDCDAVVPTADGGEAAVPAPVIYFASATATNSCGEASDLSDGCAVECLPEPCVELVCDVDKPEVCPDEEYTVTATATNCSEGVEDITIYIDGESKLFPDVAVGAEVTFEWTFTAPADCEPGSSIPHATRAVATNICNPDGVEDTCDTAVTCLPEPCVTAACSVSDTEIGNGEAATITGSAMNCSPGPETIVLTIYGPDDLSAVYKTQTFPNVEPGAIVTLDAVWSCGPDVVGIHDFRVGAVATNGCGEADAVSTEPCSIECQAGLCWLTGGGNHNDNNSKGQKLFTWGGNVGPPPAGSWQHVERDGEGNILFNFHAKDVEVYSCFHDGGDGPCHPGAENNVIIFGGTGEYSIGPGGRTERATFEVRAEDHGEPGNNPNRDGGCGSPDFYRITVKNADTDEIVFEHEDFIDGGNLQIHPLKGNQGTK